ncbi:uncharacterized protein H6S33_001805 [Morchella sextelata]|uniref:uncharacterized protein n=1 Tax=Morchella sextelata TaxID=1174677 RepID=UPI001D0543FF|nr:uncharacterized protein H6S33_001805 [Morchella sextelata]KAH0608671.1 hypothetical protein H6S33_001805 [Morchella sextelata]
MSFHSVDHFKELSRVIYRVLKGRTTLNPEADGEFLHNSEPSIYGIAIKVPEKASVGSSRVEVEEYQAHSLQMLIIPTPILPTSWGYVNSIFGPPWQLETRAEDTISSKGNPMLRSPGWWVFGQLSRYAINIMCWAGFGHGKNRRSNIIRAFYHLQQA